MVGVGDTLCLNIKHIYAKGEWQNMDMTPELWVGSKYPYQTFFSPITKTNNLFFTDTSSQAVGAALNHSLKYRLVLLQSCGQTTASPFRAPNVITPRQVYSFYSEPFFSTPPSFPKSDWGAWAERQTNNSLVLDDRDLLLFNEAVIIEWPRDQSGSEVFVLHAVGK